jgi:hypothetical protein
MRGGLRLPAMVVAIGLLAGCSDPAGAVRRERAAARKASPSPHKTAKSKKAQHRSAVLFLGPGVVKTTHGLRVRTGALRTGQIKVAFTDVGSHARRTITATSTPRNLIVGHFALTGVKLAKSTSSVAYGVTLHYRSR